MAVLPLVVGDKYRSKATDFLKRHSIPEGVDFAITNIDDDKVSLFAMYLNGNYCVGQITVAKSYFGENFTQDPYAPVNKAYSCEQHYYPDVNDTHNPIYPSPHAPRLHIRIKHKTGTPGVRG